MHFSTAYYSYACLLVCIYCRLKITAKVHRLIVVGLIIGNIIFVASLRMSLLRKHAVYKVSRLALGGASASPAALWSRQFSGAEPLVIHANRPRSTYEEAFAQSLKNRRTSGAKLPTRSPGTRSGTRCSTRPTPSSPNGAALHLFTSSLTNQ